MKKWFIVIPIVAIVIGGSAAFAVKTFQPQPKQQTVQVQPKQEVKPVVSKYDDPGVDPQEVLDLVNQEREKNGVAPLTMDLRLAQSAQKKADDMATNNYFGHQNPIDGKQGYSYIQDVAPGLCYYGSENIASNNEDKIPGTKIYDTSKGTFDTWRLSTAHHVAMIDSRYSLTGIAVAVNGPKTYVVEHFCQQ